MTGHFKGNSDKQWGQNHFKVVFEFLFDFDFMFNSRLKMENLNILVSAEIFIVIYQPDQNHKS